ncbi:TPA: DUF1642 domain-containing protein [Streptococcus suis]
MNKQEAIKRLEWYAVPSVYIPNSTEVVKFEIVKGIISQIHEPQKVVVPKFVAEIIEYHKGINGLLKDVYRESETYRCEFEKWLIEVVDAHDIVARAWLFGYEVEQELLYTVEIPNPNNRSSVVFLTKEKGKVHIGAGTFFGNVPDDKWKKDPNTHLTEAEIKKDFEWAWDAGFAKEVE